MLFNEAIRFIQKMKSNRLLLVLIVLFSFTDTGFSDSALITKENLRDAILQTKTFTTEQLTALDLNQDDVLDVSDLAFLLRHDIASSLMGEYTGFFVKNNANKSSDQGEVFGQIPVSLMITNASPLAAVVNKYRTDLGTVEPEYYSLYFPQNPGPVVTSIEESGTSEYGGLEFTIQFESVSDNLAPGTSLNREIKFSGQFNNAGKTILSGTYAESINGFIDNRGNDLNIQLSGKFLIIKE